MRRDSRATSTSTRSPGARGRCARRSPREFTRRYGVPVDADEQVTVCCGATEAMMATLLAIDRSGRRGDRLRAVLRELRPRRDPLRRDAALRHGCASPTGRFDPDELAAAFIEPHARDHHQHAEQPDRQGLHARGARASSPRSASSGTSLAITDEIYEHIVYDGHQHVPHGHARRHGRAHGDDQRAVEDLQRHRLARRLGDRAAGAHRRDPQGARLPDRGRAGAAAGGRRRRAGARRQLLPRAGRRLSRAGATCCSSILERHGFRLLPPARRVLHHDGHRARSAFQTTSRSRGTW